MAPPLDGGPPEAAPAIAPASDEPPPESDPEIAASDDAPPAPAPAPPPAEAASDVEPPEPIQVRPQEVAKVEVRDPLQPVNRVLFKVDGAINRAVAGRMRVIGRSRWAPKPLRQGLVNALNNLEEPATAANDLLQRKAGRAVKAAARFLVNSTIGIGGVLDVAKRMGLKRAGEDFGQTLAFYGVAPGVYLYLPLAGPTTLRDAIGDLVDGFVSPTHWLGLTSLERRTATVIKSQIHPSTVAIREATMRKGARGLAPDEYLALRRLYYRQRAAQVADQPNPADDPELLGRSQAPGRQASAARPEG